MFYMLYVTIIFKRGKNMILTTFLNVIEQPIIQSLMSNKRIILTIIFFIAFISSFLYSFLNRFKHLPNYFKNFICSFAISFVLALLSIPICYIIFGSICFLFFVVQFICKTLKLILSIFFNI